MNTRENLFSRFPGRRRLFFPVVHIAAPGLQQIDHTVSQVRLALENGADGCFLIPAYAGGDAKGKDDGPFSPFARNTNDTVARVRAELGDTFFLGVSYFESSMSTKIRHLSAYIDAIWVEHLVGRKPSGELDIDPDFHPLLDALTDSGWKGLVFGGFFFKGRGYMFLEDVTPLFHVQGLVFGGFFFKGRGHMFLEDEDHLLRSGPAATSYGEVTRDLVQTAATTIKLTFESHNIAFNVSGPGTSQPIELPRPEMFREILGEAAVVSVASGVDADNVDRVLPFIDVFLVATGIEKCSSNATEIEFFKAAMMPVPVQVGTLDPLKVRALADAIHAYA